MATTINKQRLLTHLFNAARKAAEAEPEPEPRPVLHEFIYALCREGATPRTGRPAFSNLCERFFDWNEVRVSSLRELEEAFDGLPNAAARAERLSAFLHEVFETEFSFDLDKQLLKKGLKLAAKQLAGYQAANDYVGAWVMQRSLGGHAIPLDAPTLRCARRLGLVDGDHQDDAERPRQPGASGAQGQGGAVHRRDELPGRQVLLGGRAALLGLSDGRRVRLRPGDRRRAAGGRRRPPTQVAINPLGNKGEGGVSLLIPGQVGARMLNQGG